MFSEIKTVLCEMAFNIKRVWRLTIYEKKAKNSESKLGNLWELLNPLLNIFVYWFVFSVGLRSNVAHGTDYPYAIWLICGLMPWLTISGTMTQSTCALTAAAGLIKSCNIPLSIFPFKSVMHGMVNYIFTLLIIAGVVLFSGLSLTWYAVEVVYYTAAMLIFLIGFALVASAINVFFNDLQKLLPAFLRLLMYASSVVINIQNFPTNIQILLRLNPLVHLVEGFRFCLLDGQGILTHPISFASFWVVTLLLLAVGCVLHMRLRDRFVDML